MIKKLISLTIAVGIICIFFFTDVLAEPQLEDFGEYPIVLADMNFDDLNTGTIIDKNTDPDKYFFKDDKTGPGGNDDGITPAVEIVEKDSRKYAKVITYTNANEAFGVSAKVTQDSLVENGLTEYPDKIKVEYDIMKDGHNQAVYGFIGHSSPIANAAKDWGEFMQWGAGNTFSFARQMSAPVTSSTAVAVGTWAHVDLYFDFTARTFDCFVNGTYLGKAELKPGMTTPEYLSFSCYTNNKETSNLCVDNIKISAERALVSIYQEDMETGDASMNVKHRTLVESPVDPDHHGKVLKLPFSASSDNYCMPRHSVIENSFAGGKLKKIRASFDILFEDYASASITLYSSETLPSGSKNYFTLMQFTKDGKCKTDNYDLSYRASSTWRHLRDEGYSLGKWYNIKTELDIDSQTFSLFIDDELIAQNVSFKTSANVPLIDFLTYRIQISRNTVENAPDGYVYADNFKYEIPYSQLYDHTGIYTHIDDKLLTVDAVAIGEDSAALWAARFENDVLADFARINAKLIDNMLFARYNCEVQEGSEYKFFLFDGPSSIRPLADKVEYRSFSESDYRQVIENWRSFLVGSTPDLNNDQVVKRIKNINNTAASYQNTMNKTVNRTSLWGAAYDKSDDLVTEYKKIYAMALAYGTQGGALYKNTSLRADIKDALEWMYLNRYGQAEIYGYGWRDIRSFNWWDWFVGAPTAIVNTLMIMEGEEGFSQNDIEKYFELYDYLCAFMQTDLTDPSIINSRTYARFGADVLTKNDMGIKTLMNAYPVLFRFVSGGASGMYEDYSYLAHNRHPYTGVYGSEALLDRIVKIMAITEGTAFELDDGSINTYTKWIFNAFEPLMANGGVMSMVRGRGVDGGSERQQGIYVIQSVLNMIDAVENKFPDDAVKLKQLVKRNADNDMYSSLTLPQIAKLDEILQDASVPDIQPYENTRIYYNMDRVVHQKGNWSAGLALSSERTSNYESINGQNENGWYTADGMLYLYTDDVRYDTDYFRYADPYKRPGTTVDNQERMLANVLNGQEYFSSKDFVGGAVLDNSYAVVAMDLESFHNDIEPVDTDYSGPGGDQPLHNCDLTAKKAWFMFDNEIVCLGADIDASAHSVYTTVENRRVTNNTLNVNGTSLSYGTSGSTNKPKYAHIEGTGGYYFPLGGTLRYRQVTNEGHKFFEMWLEHGTAPTDASYAYTVLPGMTAEETAAYADAPKTVILSNTADVQAVCQTELGITGYVFRNAVSFDEITVSAPLTVIKKATGDGMELALSDPTFKLDSATITLDGVYTAKSFDNNIAIKVENGKTVITIDFTQMDGKTLNIIF